VVSRSPIAFDASFAARPGRRCTGFARRCPTPLGAARAAVSNDGMSLVECVPNFSEGRDPAKVERILEAVRSVAGVRLIDSSMDASHNRRRHARRLAARRGGSGVPRDREGA